MTIAMRPAYSPCGKRLLFMGSDTAVPFSGAFQKGVKLFCLDLTDGQVVEVLGSAWSISEAAWSPCGERVVFAGAFDSHLTVPTLGLWVVNRDGSNPQCRTEGVIGNIGLRFHHDMPTWSTSQSNIFVVPDSSRAYATVTAGGCGEIWRIALEGPCDCEPVASGQRSCLIMDANAKASLLLYCVSDLHKPWDLYRANLEGGGEKCITELNTAVLARWPRLQCEHLRFESADGVALEGWFLARADRQRPHPTVMFVHAGPFLATGHAFRFDFHLLAANGYGVLFANFRGSSGYSEAFARAIMGDWGGRGFPDHMAAANAAVGRGLADADRLGVWGASHGGFATCWIVTHTTRFRAAVAESAVTNFATMYYLSDAPHLFAFDLGGRPDEIPDVYRSRSPLTYASRCRTPTLMLHGEEDLRCPMAEAEQFYRALHDGGCTTELAQIPGMNHMGDSTGPLAARHGQNEALLDWFERYL
jgi:dipeptidyl aminopeptidase/acylaminoacyl peptidase